MEKKLESRKSIYFKYTLCFLVTGILVFGWLVAYGKSFVWDFDGVFQHFNTLAYYGKYLRKILMTLVREHRFVLPMWDLSIGFGSDILTTLNYYAIGDPLTLLAVLVPGSRTEYLYAVLIVIRIYLSGVAFIAFCRYHKNQGTGVLLGAVTYCFSGFVLFCGARHPYFINPMIYLPVILIGIDKIFNREKPWLFVGMTAISAISNFYFFYMIAIVMVIYAVFRYLMIYGRIRIKEMVPWLLKFAGWSFLGIGIAMPILLPSAMYVLGTGRMSAKNYIPVLYPLAHYARLLNDFFGVDYIAASPRYYTVTGFAPIILVALFVLLVSRKKHRELKWGWVVLTALLLIPYAGHVMNGFSYVSNRWIWAYGMLLAYILVKLYPDFLELKKSEKRTLAVIGCVVLPAAQLLLSKYATLHGWLGIGMTAVTIVILLICSGMKKQQFFAAAMVVTTIVSIAGNAYFLFSPDQTNYLKAFRAKGAPYAWLTNQAQNNLVKELEDTDTFYRYDQYGNIARENTAMQNRLYSTDFYYSVTNGAVAEFFREMDTSNPIEQMYDGLDGRTILDRLTGVRYFIVKKGHEEYLPYGYEEKVAENKKYTVYKTEQTLPFGYTCDSVITQEVWEELSVTKKQQALLQGAYIQGETEYDTDLAQTSLVFHDVKPEYEITTDGDIQIEGNQYVIGKSGASITLHYQGVENCETYLVLEGLNYDGEATKFGMTVTRDDVEKKETVYTERNSFYSGKENFLYNTGYHEDASSEVTLTFRKAGVFTIENLYLAEQPMESLDQQTEALKENILENVEFDENTVKGTITLDEKKILVLSMAYSKGWKAYVDGKEQTVLQANGMFCGLELDAGEHVVEMHYCTPYLIPGLIISALCLTGIVIFLIWKKKCK